MFKCVFLVFATLTVVHGRKQCFDIVCPDSLILPNDTMASAYMRYFDNEDYPENGRCLEGKVVCRIYGKDWGRPGISRCACVDVNGLSKIVPNTECTEGIPKCHPMIQIYKDEGVADFYKRFGQRYRFNVVSDGCCPSNFIKSILSPALTGLDKDLCYCEPQPGQLVFNEGSVPIKSISSSTCSSEDY